MNVSAWQWPALWLWHNRHAAMFGACIFAAWEIVAHFGGLKPISSRRRVGCCGAYTSAATSGPARVADIFPDDSRIFNCGHGRDRRWMDHWANRRVCMTRSIRQFHPPGASEGGAGAAVDSLVWCGCSFEDDAGVLNLVLSGRDQYGDRIEEPRRETRAAMRRRCHAVAGSCSVASKCRLRFRRSLQD